MHRPVVHFVNDHHGRAVYEHDDRTDDEHQRADDQLVHQYKHVNNGGTNYVDVDLDYDNDPGPHNHVNVTGYPYDSCPKCDWMRAQQSRVL